MTGSEIARAMGLPDAPAGYRWQRVNGGRSLRVQRIDTSLPELVYDPAERAFVNRSAYRRPGARGPRSEPTVPRELETRATRSRAARDRVAAHEGEQRTYASDERGGETPSGWAGDEATVNDVMEMSRRIGHEPEPNPARDQGVRGRYNSSHAEKKRAARGGRDIGVSREMCADCQRFFRALAEHERRTIIVADPTGLRIFMPDYVTWFIEGAAPLAGAQAAEETIERSDEAEPVTE